MQREISTTAVHMTYDHVQKWVYHNNMKAYEEIKAELSPDDTCVVLYKDNAQLGTILPNVRYVAKGAFHQWRQNDKVFALKFKTEELASTWNNVITEMIVYMKKNSKKGSFATIDHPRIVASDGNIAAAAKPPPPSRRGPPVKTESAQIAQSASEPPKAVPPPRRAPPPTTASAPAPPLTSSASVPPPAPRAVPPPPPALSVAAPPPAPRAVPPPPPAPIVAAAPPPAPRAVPPAPSVAAPPPSAIPPPPPPPAGVPPPPPPPSGDAGAVPPPPPPPAAGGGTAAPPNLLDAIRTARLNKSNAPPRAEAEKAAPKPAPALNMMEEMQKRLNKRRAIEKSVEGSNVSEVISPMESKPSLAPARVAPAPAKVVAPPPAKTPINIGPFGNSTSSIVGSTKNGSANLTITREEFEKFKQETHDLIKEGFRTLTDMISKMNPN